MNKADRERIKAEAQRLKAEKEVTKMIAESPKEPAKKIIQKREPKPKAPPPPPTPPKEPREKRHKYNLKERLPDGSAFAAVYHASETQWDGSLTIDGFPVFSGKHSAVMALLVRLDNQYRAELQRREQPEIPPT